MTPGDIAQIQLLAQGEGEMRMSKRVVRALLAQLAMTSATHRAQAIVGRVVGTAG